MSEPNTFTIATPKVATEIPAARVGRAGVDHGPNFFLQPIPAGTPGVEEGYDKGWLHLSYVEGRWYDVPCDGQWVEQEIVKGDRKGEVVEKLTGDAREISRQLREAADELGIGVSIKDFPVTYASGKNKGQEIPGKMLLKYLGQKRKQRKPKPAATVVESTEE